jgi:hypothetical protein
MSSPKNSPALLTAFQRIAQHRATQHRQLLAGHVYFNCDSPVADDHRKLRRLTQQLGRLAGALDALEHRNHAPQRAQRQRALIALAADTVAWLESLEPKNLPRRPGVPAVKSNHQP